MGFDLAEFDDDDLQPKEGSGFQDESAVKDGPHEFEVLEGRIKRVNESTIFEMKLKIVGGEQDGLVFYRSHWLNTKENREFFMGDLKKFGFDVASWGDKNSAKPRSEQIPLAIHLLPGIRFSGTKTTKKGSKDDKIWHNVYVTKRIEDNRPKVFTDEHLKEAAEDMAKDIPF